MTGGGGQPWVGGEGDALLALQGSREGVVPPHSQQREGRDAWRWLRHQAPVSPWAGLCPPPALTE